MPCHLPQTQSLLAHLVVTMSGAVTDTSWRSNVTEKRAFSTRIMNWYPLRSVKREIGSSNTMSLAYAELLTSCKHVGRWAGMYNPARLFVLYVCMDGLHCGWHALLCSAACLQSYSLKGVWSVLGPLQIANCCGSYHLSVKACIGAS